LPLKNAPGEKKRKVNWFMGNGIYPKVRKPRNNVDSYLTN
jgi:hypothetical protein